MHTHIQTHECANTYTHTHSCMHTHTYTHIHAHITHEPACIHTYTCMHIIVIHTLWIHVIHHCDEFMHKGKPGYVSMVLVWADYEEVYTPCVHCFLGILYTFLSVFLKRGLPSPLNKPLFHHLLVELYFDIYSTSLTRLLYIIISNDY